MAGFDRIKPPDARIRQRDPSRRPDAEDADREGRAAVFRPPAVDDPPAPPTAPPAGVPDPPRRRRPDVDVGEDPRDEEVTIDPPPARPREDGGGGAGADEGGTQAAREARVPTGRSVLHMECSHCGITAPMPLGTAVRRALPLALVVPTRSHPVFATCPCGERRTWLRPSVGMPR